MWFTAVIPKLWKQARDLDEIRNEPCLKGRKKKIERNGLKRRQAQNSTRKMSVSRREGPSAGVAGVSFRLLGIVGRIEEAAGDPAFSRTRKSGLQCG